VHDDRYCRLHESTKTWLYANILDYGISCIFLASNSH
jgi:hypothetical protein